MTDNLARQLKLPLEKLELPIEAINDSQSKTNYKITATINSRLNGFSRTLTFLTVPRIGHLFPVEPIDRNNLDIPRNLQLADPHFDQPSPVDMLLNVGTTLATICQGQIRLNGLNEPDMILQETRFGWIIGGSSLSAKPLVRKQKLQTYAISVEKELKDFWEMDDIHTSKHWSKEEQACEDFFLETVTRDETGRYVVSLPFNGKQTHLKNCRELAKNCFKSLLRKFKRNPEYERQYTAVMQEYLDLGHMRKIEVSSEDEEGYYMPHHGVSKSSSLTTKLRVVFNASAHEDDAPSLNDTLMTGPVIQTDLTSNLIHWMTLEFVLSGDVEKMYRQFLVRPQDQQYQKTWWIENGKWGVYVLTRVTFGVRSSAHHSIRCMHKIAEDKEREFPRAAKALKDHMYVDDFRSGANSFEEALQLRNEVITLLSNAQLNIRQWASNDPRLLEGLPEESVIQLDKTTDGSVKNLGLYWNPKKDTIFYAVNSIQVNAKFTKRTMLSEVSKIFDPLGFLGPVIIKGRMILHRLWLEQLGWDDAVPLSILTEWRTYASQLPEIRNMTFDRHRVIPQAREVQLHGFCDASEKGYGACIYVRSVNSHGEVKTRLIVSKSRVAPIKTVSLPRLELCAALLLAKLYPVAKKAVDLKIDRVVFWSDSMVALHWIKTPPHKLLVFVANRVAGIQERTDGVEWRHVRSKDNPADHISRGLFPNEFLQVTNWKEGPEWLSESEDNWPRSELVILPEIPEMRKTQCLLTGAPEKSKSPPDQTNLSFILRFSSIGQLRRLFAIGLRFKTRLKGPISVDELRFANERIIKMVQESEFAEEIKDLKKHQNLPSNHKWKSLDPFIDERGLIRVGGRLKNASIPYPQKHPLLIPKNHHLTTLLIRNEHLTNLHAGSQATLYSLRRRYWLLDGRQQVRKVIKDCVTCVRANPPRVQYVMGNIPRARVTKAQLFSNVGVDYCGPFYVKEKKHRNRNKVKVWVAIFICMVVKVIHLEVVTDLTTEGFIAALKRFIARRGKPNNIYSDNGTNFVGANNEIKELYSFLQSKEYNEKIYDHLAEQEINWHFIPPASPNFGGLWEAGVKSFKHHLKRICNELVTYEQFTTLVTEIEAVLNSRPLTPISSDPNDLSALCPSNFTHGDSVMGLPEPDFTKTPDNRLSAWELIQKRQQEFWKRWHVEYLNELNNRHKWNRGSHDIQTGTLVIIREDNLPPRQWSLGRVIQVYPGSDGIIRVVKVKTAKGEFDRNVQKLSPLLSS